MQVISVVRNFEMYNKLVRNNPYYGEQAEFIIFDNNKENKSITARYNEFLKSYNYSKEDWFVFCHEDWELKENLLPKLENLDKNYLYGPVGITLGKWYKEAMILGLIIQSNKDGTSAISIGNYAYFDNNVGTFDCQCLILHSSLIKKYNLIFDENLLFDLYVEDFCINAREKYNLCSKIVPVKCQHYSYGRVAESFYNQLTYLKNKYLTVNKTYYSTVNGEVICDHLPVFMQKMRPYIDKLLHFFFQRRITNSGRYLIKICKIPVYSKKDSKYTSL